MIDAARMHAAATEYTVEIRIDPVKRRDRKYAASDQSKSAVGRLASYKAPYQQNDACRSEGKPGIARQRNRRRYMMSAASGRSLCGAAKHGHNHRLDEQE